MVAGSHLMKEIALGKAAGVAFSIIRQVEWGIAKCPQD
jgi:hypothetical protein